MITPLPDTDRRRRIYLLRHSRVDYLATDENGQPVDSNEVHLTPGGRELARETGKLLSDVQFDRVVCSGLNRTFQTAEEVLSSQNRGNHIPEIEEDIRFIEMHHGDLPGERPDDPTKLAAYLIDAMYEAYEDAVEGKEFGDGGETFADVEARTGPALDDLMADYTWTNLLLVAHGGVNRYMLSRFLCGSHMAMQQIEQDLCAVNVIDFDHKANGHVDRHYVKVMNVTVDHPAKVGVHRIAMETLFHRDENWT